MCRYPAAETLGQVSLGVMSVQEAAAVVIGLRMISIEANAMKLLAGVLAAILLLASAGGSHAVVRIANDRGGLIGPYMDRYEKLSDSRETIVIDGLCASACTIVLGAIPYNRICVTPNANLAFHAAWNFGARGRAIPNRAATTDLFLMYPSQIRRWIVGRGGLTPRMIFLRGRQLTAMYRPCNLGLRHLVGRHGPASLNEKSATVPEPRRPAPACGTQRSKRKVC